MIYQSSSPLSNFGFLFHLNALNWIVGLFDFVCCIAVHGVSHGLTVWMAKRFNVDIDEMARNFGLALYVLSAPWCSFFMSLLLHLLMLQFCIATNSLLVNLHTDHIT